MDKKATFTKNGVTVTLENYTPEEISRIIGNSEKPKYKDISEDLKILKTLKDKDSHNSLFHPSIIISSTKMI